MLLKGVPDGNEAIPKAMDTIGRYPGSHGMGLSQWRHMNDVLNHQQLDSLSAACSSYNWNNKGPYYWPFVSGLHW